MNTRPFLGPEGAAAAAAAGPGVGVAGAGAWNTNLQLEKPQTKNGQKQICLCWKVTVSPVLEQGWKRLPRQSLRNL